MPGRSRIRRNPIHPRWASHDNWPLYCCDYFFVTQDLAPRVHAVRVDAITQASDHQSVILELQD